MKNYFNHKMRGKSPAAIAGMIVLGIIAITGLAILFGFVIMWLWNWLMPELFGLPALTYWQAVGLFILMKIFVGGGGGKGSSSKHKRHSDHSCEKGRKKKRDFSKWEHYDKFWEEHGDQAYAEYVEKLEGGTSESDIQTTAEDSTEDATEEKE